MKARIQDDWASRPTGDGAIPYFHIQCYSVVTFYESVRSEAIPKLPENEEKEFGYPNRIHVSHECELRGWQ